jgi:hypothetical protein
MAITKIGLRPGVNREGTNYSAEGFYYDCDKIRFRSGKPEKIGGWQRLSNSSFQGTCRSIENWSTLAGDNYVGLGTNLKYYIESGGGYNDVTPIRKTVDPMLGPVPPSTGNPFSSAFNTLSADITAAQQSIPLTSAASFPSTGGVIKIGTEEINYSSISSNTLLGAVRGFNGTTAQTHSSSANVSCSTIIVTDVNHDATKNDFMTFSGATTFNAFTDVLLNAEHQVFQYISTTQYSINIVDVFSTAVASGGGASIIASYQVNTGLDIYVIGLGWGADPWGSGGWGDPGLVGVGQQLRLWAADNYGEDLLLNPRQGSIYYWDATLGLTTRAKLLNDLSTAAGFDGTFVPNTTNEITSSPTERFAMAMGANPYDPTDANTEFDPMLVRWSDQENVYEWVPAITNQSGEFRLSNGSYIVSSDTTRQETLIWTDSALYSAQYLGPPFVWGFTMLASNISVISPNAMITANNITYWMGVDKFYIYSGRTETLQCALRQYIFSDINKDQGYQVFAGTNEGYNEIWWFYCSGQSTTINKYVVFNYAEDIWYYGSLARTAWLDSSLREYPMATNYENRIIYQELGTDDVEGEFPVAVTAFIQSADFDIGDGDKFAFVWRILPDVNFTGSNVDKPSVTMTLKPRRNAGAPYSPADAPTIASKDNYTGGRQYNIQEFDGQVNTRIRGRQMALRVESTGLGVTWQLGDIRIDAKSDGSR